MSVHDWLHGVIYEDARLNEISPPLPETGLRSEARPTQAEAEAAEKGLLSKAADKLKEAIGNDR